MGGDLPTRRHRVVRRLRGGVGPAHLVAGRPGRVHPARRLEAAELVPVQLRPRRRGPGRGADLHQLRGRDRRRPHQQLAGTGGDERGGAALLPRRHAGPDHVRGALLDGPARLAHRPHRRPAHRQPLRRRQHEDHDPHGPGRPRRARRRPSGSSCIHSVGLSARRRRGRRASRRGVAVRPRQQVHLPLPRGSGDLVVRLRATAATPCWARSASPCASPPPWPATRAGWPSTC